MRTWSKRAATKAANEQQNGTLPASDRPAATPSMFASAIPIWKKRSGYFLANFFDRVLSERSASSTTSSGCVSPSRAIASPKESRDATDVDPGSFLTGAPISVAPFERGLGSAQLFHGVLQLRLRRRDTVPAHLAFHERHAFPFRRLREDERRLALGRARRGEGRLDRRVVVPVARHHVPVERAPLVGDRVQAHDLVDEAVDLT